jgi:hypothetical protein
MMRHIRMLLPSVKNPDAFASKESRRRAEPSWSEPAFARRERRVNAGYAELRPVEP